MGQHNVGTSPAPRAGSRSGSRAGSLAGLLAELIAFPTVSRTPNVALQAWLAGRLEDLGARVGVVQGVAPDRANLVATIGPDTPGGVLLSGHTDVVPPGDGWSSDPWQLVQTGTRLRGRGAADMKGFFAATLVALASVDPRELVAPVHVVASYDEEIGCQGVRDILPVLAGSPVLRPELVVVGEPTMMRPRHAHLGKQLYELCVRAADAHSGRAASMPSAIAGAAEVVAAISAVQAGAPRVPDGEMPPYSLNCGTIHGGTAANVIAAACDVTFEVRHDADHDPGQVLVPVNDAVSAVHARLAAVGGGATCTLTTAYPAMNTDVTGAAFATAVRVIDGGSSTTLGYGTEGGLLTDALGLPVMICGPGDIADAHRPDESIEAAQLDRCVQVVRRLVDAFCSAR